MTSTTNLTIALQACPLENMDPKKETTLLLGAEACKRYKKVYYYSIKDLFLEDSKAYAWARPVHIDEGEENTLHFIGETEKLDLSLCDVILIRQNPPVNQEYLLTTYILDHLPPTTHLLNNPKAIRNLNGKIFPGEFPEFIVPYAIGNDKKVLTMFLEKHGDIILKPLGGFGGSGIFRIKSGDNAADIFETFRAGNPGLFVVQKYIPEAVKGDKRIILFDGDPVSALLRVPSAPDVPANITLGASIEKTEITPHEHKLCAALGPRLKELGLFFVGLDMLGDYVAEINIISPGTIRPANNLYNNALEKTFWDKVEQKIANAPEQLTNTL